MHKELWSPSETDRICAGKGYVKYALGVVMLNEPERMKSIFGVKEIDQTNTDRIYAHASNVVRGGLTEVIRYSNEPSIRSVLIKMEDTFEVSLPHMLSAVDYAYENFGDQLEDLNPSLKVVRPLPISNQVIYGNICHSRVAKLDAANLMDGYMLADVFVGEHN